MVYALFYKNLQVTFMANFQLSWPRDMGYREQLGDEEESLILLKESVLFWIDVLKSINFYQSLMTTEIVLLNWLVHASQAI